MKGKERRSFSNGKRIEWWVRGGGRGRHIPESNPFSSKGLCLCLVTQLCPTLWDPMDCSPSGSSVHGIFQTRILERVAIPSSRGSSQPRDQPMIPGLLHCRQILYCWANGEDLGTHNLILRMRSHCRPWSTHWNGRRPLWNCIQNEVMCEFPRFCVFDQIIKGSCDERLGTSK